MVTCAALKSSPPCGGVPFRITGSTIGQVSNAWLDELRASIKARGWSIGDAAREAELTRQYLSDVLTRRRTTLPIETYLRLCTLMGVDERVHVISTTDTRLVPDQETTR